MVPSYWNKLSFNREDVKDKFNIKMHSHFPEAEVIEVKSSITGVVKKFSFDRDRTSHECEMHEGWDGEEYHRWYLSECGNISLELYHSPYCEF